MSVFVCKRHFWWRHIWRHLHVTILKCWDKFSNVLIRWSIKMFRAKNYKTVTKFVKVMPRILWPLFSRTRCIMIAAKIVFVGFWGKGWQSRNLWGAAAARRLSWLCACGMYVGSVQESLANAKVSARQPWYIGRNTLNRPRLGSPSNINVVYTSLKSTFSAQQFPRWQCGSIFIRLAVVASQTRQLAQNSEKIWTYSSSRSSKVDDFGTNQKCICHFLLVINNSNFGPILHRFWDTATYWLKIAYFCYPSLIRRASAPAVFPLEFHGEVKRHETTPCLKKLCQLIFCSLSVKYEPISIKIGRTVPE